MEYTFLDNLKDFKILDFPVEKLECKHVILNEPTTIFEASVRAGYEYVILGSHRHASIEDENKRILTMQESKTFNRPVRVVKAKDERLWCDNTHTAMAYLRRNYKKQIALKDIPFYLIDVSGNKPVVVSVRNSVIQNDECIINAINCALQINNRLSQGVRPDGMSYTIGELNNMLSAFTSLLFKKWYGNIAKEPSCLLSELNHT